MIIRCRRHDSTISRRSARSSFTPPGRICWISGREGQATPPAMPLVLAALNSPTPADFGWSPLQTPLDAREGSVRSFRGSDGCAVTRSASRRVSSDRLPDPPRPDVRGRRPGTRVRRTRCGGRKGPSTEVVGAQAAVGLRRAFGVRGLCKGADRGELRVPAGSGPVGQVHWEADAATNRGRRGSACGEPTSPWKRSLAKPFGRCPHLSASPRLADGGPHEPARVG